jgi:hypothetical protein
MSQPNRRTVLAGGVESRRGIHIQEAKTRRPRRKTWLFRFKLRLIYTKYMPQSKHRIVLV